MPVRHVQTSPIIKISRQPRTAAGRAILLFLRFVFGIAKIVRSEAGINPFIRIAVTPIRCNDTISLSVGRDVEFEVPISDPYWMHVALSGEYETDIYGFISSMKKSETLFIDCGANIGWWSIIANKSLGWKVVAIEAASHLVRRLEINAIQNNANIVVEQKAIWSKTGDFLQFATSEGSHAGGHICQIVAHISDSRLGVKEGVETITIDEAVNLSLTREIERIVIKVDVEGAETEALSGAVESIKSGAILIYEDHGSDFLCKASEAVFNQGCVVYALSVQEPTPCYSIADVRKLKTSRIRGYNFIAVGKESQFAKIPISLW